MAYDNPLVANGNTFHPLWTGVNATTLTTGKYFDHGFIAPAPMASRPIYQDDAKTWPAVDGVAHVRHGFRGRLLFAALVFAGADEGAVNDLSKTTLESLSQLARYNVTLPVGTSYDGCKLADNGQGSWVNMSGGVILVVPVVFNQLSLTN